MSDIQKLLNIENGYLNYEGDSNATTQAQMQQYLTNQNKVLANIVSKLWQPSTAYSVGDRIFSPNMSPGVVAEVTSAGTSGSIEPSWGTVGNNVNDNTVTWTMIKYATTANAQPLNSLLTAFSRLSASSGKVPYFTGNNTMSTTTISNFAKTFLDDSDAATLRQTIGATAENCGGIVAASLTTNGYVKFANGLIIQWGLVKVNDVIANEVITITYPIAFSIPIIISIWPVTGKSVLTNYVAEITNDYSRSESFNFIASYKTGCKWFALGK